MMSLCVDPVKCPMCGATLTVDLKAGSPPAQSMKPLNPEDPYYDQPEWRVSAKNPRLATILANDEAFSNPEVADLYNKLREVKTLKLGPVTYKISPWQGLEFLQRWGHRRG